MSSLIKDLSMRQVAPKPGDAPVIETKPSGFSMIREFNVQKALKTSDGSDAGKSDVVDRAAAASDIGFNLMRNTINASGSVTGSDVADYIERAEELNDEVDTVPFGLETDDGKIVKVYVNAEQADKFEEAMKNMLGLEDDIEEAINRLTADFDIVDVVWPKADDEDGDGVPDPDKDLSIDDTSNLDDPEDDADFADDQYDVIAGGDDNVPPEVDAGTGKAKAAPDETEPEEEPTDDKSDDEEEPPAEDEEGEEPGADKPKKPKRKRKNGNPAPAEPAAAAESTIPDGPVLNEKQNTQEKDMTIGTRFLERVLQEAEGGEDRDGVKDGLNIPLDSQARAMAAKQKLPWAKRLVAFHFMCGVPGRYMNSAEVSEAIAGAADMLRKKVAVRRAFTTLYEGLGAAKGYTIKADDATNEAKKASGWESIDDPDKLWSWCEDNLTDDQMEKLSGQMQGLHIEDEADNEEAMSIMGKFLHKNAPKPVQEAKKSSALGADPDKLAKAKDAVKAAKKALADHKKTYDGGTGMREKQLQADIDKAMGKLAKLTEEVVELNEAKAKRGSFIQKLLESVLVQLGLPDSMIVTSGPAAVGTGIYQTAELIEQDSKLERALRLLATRMGIKGQDAMQGVEESLDEAKKPKLPKDKDVPIEVTGVKGMKSTPWSKKFKNQEAMEKWFDKNGEDITVHAYSTDRVNEDVEPDARFGQLSKLASRKSVDEAVDVGNDQYAQAVTALVSALGIPDDILERRRTQVVQALRQKKATLGNRAQIFTMMTRLQDLLAKNTVKAGQGPAQADDEDNP